MKEEKEQVFPLLRFHLHQLETQARLTQTSLELPENLTSEQWEKTGLALGNVQQSTIWWIGDWWAYGHQYGKRKEIVERDDWTGPVFDTCVKAAWVCRAFESLPRRRLSLTFTHHQEVASLSPEEADGLLDECEAEKLTVKQLRERVKKTKTFLAQDWNKSQLARKAEVEIGNSVLASMQNTDKGVPLDNALITWAESQGLAVRIDRTSDWGNPYEIDKDGTREEVIEWYREYFDHKKSLHERLGELEGKVLICWCTPEECHGDVLLELLVPE
jgi:hypothetical protein